MVLLDDVHHQTDQWLCKEALSPRQSLRTPCHLEPSSGSHPLTEPSGPGRHPGKYAFRDWGSATKYILYLKRIPKIVGSSLLKWSHKVHHYLLQWFTWYVGSALRSCVGGIDMLVYSTLCAFTYELCYIILHFWPPEVVPSS